MARFVRAYLITMLLGLSAWVGYGADATAPGSAPAPAPASLHVSVAAEARRILANVRTTRYQHKTDVDEARGAYALDCSGLACLILKKVAPRQLAVIAIEERHTRQRAWEFYETFRKAAAQETPGWRAIRRLMDAQPGDVLARRNQEIVPGESTGHVMIIAAAPVEEKPGRIRVVVIDSTGRPHADDTRAAGTGGVGRGTIWVEVDHAGEPMGLRARVDAKGPRMALAIGRVEDIPPERTVK